MKQNPSIGYKDLGYTSYEEYCNSPYFVRLRKLVGVGKRRCRRCHKRLVTIPHHLHYKTLGNEKRRDVVGVCFTCNSLCHFYKSGVRVPVTTDGYYLTKRWKEINSLWWKFKQLRPSDVLHL